MTDAREIPLWARPFVSAAYARELIRGCSDGSFQPSRQITRAELVALAVRALPDGVSPQTAEAPATWADEKEIPDWALPSAETATQLGLIGPFWGDRVRAGDPVTRAEAAAVIWRLIDLRR